MLHCTPDSAVKIETGETFTVKLCEISQPLVLVYLIIVAPAAKEVTNPGLDTVATEVLDDVQVPPAGGVTCVVVPT